MVFSRVPKLHIGPAAFKSRSASGRQRGQARSLDLAGLVVVLPNTTAQGHRETDSKTHNQANHDNGHKNFDDQSLFLGNTLPPGHLGLGQAVTLLLEWSEMTPGAIAELA